MNRFEIKFFHRRHQDIDSEVEYIGGFNSDGSKWKLSIENAVKFIESGKGIFFITKQGAELDISIDAEKKLLKVIINQPIILPINDINL